MASSNVIIMLRRSSTRKLFFRRLASLHHAQTTPTTVCSSSSCFSSSLEQHEQQRSVGGKNIVRRHWKTPKDDDDDVFFTFPPTKGRRFLSNNAFEDDALEKRVRFFTRDDADPHVQRRWKSTKASSSSSAKEGKSNSKRFRSRLGVRQALKVLVLSSGNRAPKWHTFLQDML